MEIKKIYNQLSGLFFLIFLHLISNKDVNYANMFKTQGEPDKKILKALEEIFYIFGDFGRWFKIKHIEKKSDSDKIIDFESMFFIFWLLSGNTLVSSFKSDVISKIIDESGNDKFIFTKINTEVDRWLKDKVAKILFPNLIQKLKTDSVFKMGFMVKNLIEEFLVNNLTSDHHTKIPLKRYFPPSSSYHFHFEGNETEEELRKISDEWLRMMDDRQKLNISNLSNDEKFKIFEQTYYFEGVKQVKNQNKPFINDRVAVYAEGFLNNILNQNIIPGFIDHRLYRREYRIPGMLQENNKAQKLLQEKINEMTLHLIDELVDYQYTFISCIEWKELSEYL